eukprot:GHVT01032816.1.p1 GENE.GHVT01032816.1~~GHVT01032816.1.p1  ORF type:complete len:208 (-),score=52.02 GHVT01032816.1:1436-2059(-)
MMDVPPEVAAARERLAKKFAASQQLGGKGTARRKTKKVHKTVGDDKKLQQTLKRLGVSQIPGIEEVQIIQSGRIMHFASPRVQAAPAANTYVIAGQYEERRVRSLPQLLKESGLSDGTPDGANFSPEVLQLLQAQFASMQAPSGQDAADAVSAKTESDKKTDSGMTPEKTLKEGKKAAGSAKITAVDDDDLDGVPDVQGDFEQVAKD